MHPHVGIFAAGIFALCVIGTAIGFFVSNRRARRREQAEDLERDLHTPFLTEKPYSRVQYDLDLADGKVDIVRATEAGLAVPPRAGRPVSPLHQQRGKTTPPRSPGGLRPPRSPVRSRSPLSPRSMPRSPLSPHPTLAPLSLYASPYPSPYSSHSSRHGSHSPHSPHSPLVGPSSSAHSLPHPHGHGPRNHSPTPPPRPPTPTLPPSSYPSPPNVLAAPRRGKSLVWRQRRDELPPHEEMPRQEASVEPAPAEPRTSDVASPRVSEAYDGAELEKRPRMVVGGNEPGQGQDEKTGGEVEMIETVEGSTGGNDHAQAQSPEREGDEKFYPARTGEEAEGDTNVASEPSDNTSDATSSNNTDEHHDHHHRPSTTSDGTGNISDTPDNTTDATSDTTDTRIGTPDGSLSRNSSVRSNRRRSRPGSFDPRRSAKYGRLSFEGPMEDSELLLAAQLAAQLGVDVPPSIVEESEPRTPVQV